jgi:hypothetical protein
MNSSMVLLSELVVSPNISNSCQEGPVQDLAPILCWALAKARANASEWCLEIVVVNPSVSETG